MEKKSELVVKRPGCSGEKASESGVAMKQSESEPLPQPKDKPPINSMNRGKGTEH